MNDSKLTADKFLIKAHMPKVIRIPLFQNAGTSPKLVVSAGELVEEGQIIGEASGDISVPIHASVSGRIKAIEKGTVLNLKSTEIVVIETGGIVKNWVERKQNYSSLSPAQLLEEIKKAGVVGLGGEMFPAHIKLNPPKDKKISTLLINGTECEPYITIDHRMMLEKTDEILEGIRIIMKILSVDKAVISIAENKPDAIEIFSSRLAGDPSITVETVGIKYPQGNEKQLIQAVFGKEVPSKALPMDIGIMVENISTVYAIYEAIVYKKPLIERGITYTGNDVKAGGNIKVKIGTPVSELFEDLGIPEARGTILSGGPMRGCEISDWNTPITKGTTGIVVLPKKKDYKVKNRPCIRCSKCLSVCPMNLEPTELARLCDGLLLEEAERIGLFDCIECGCCSYACPSTIPITTLIRYGKTQWKE